MTTTSAPSLIEGDHLLSEFFRIELKGADPKTDLIWDTGETKAHSPAAFWRVTPSPGFFTLGHLVTTQRDSDGWIAPHAFTLAPKPGHEDLLAAPTGVEQVWDDAGTGTSRWLHIWRVKAPPGYVALGDIITGGGEPDLADVRCVKQSTVNAAGKVVNLLAGATFTDFAGAGDKTPVAFWNDSGSRAKRDVSVWLMQVAGRPGVDEVHLVPGTFLTSKRHDETPKAKPYALVLAFPQPDILETPEMEDKKVRLTQRRLPTAAELQQTRVIDEYELPFFAVRDPNYRTQLEQFEASPVYRVERTTQYEAIDSFAPVNTETKEYSVTVGTSTEHNYSNAVGVALGLSVEIGGEAGIAVASTSMKVTASVEVSYSHTWGGATSKSEERAYSYPQTVTGGSFGALFQARSSYAIYRKDGTRVGAPVEVKVNELYTDEWPHPSIHLDPETRPSSNLITFTIEAPPGKIVILEGRLEIRDGQVTRLPAVVAAPPTERALNFGADATPITVGDVLTASYTKEAWLRVPADVVAQDQNILSGGDTGAHAFWITNGKVSAGHNGSWTAVVSDTPATTEWEHYAVSYDGASGEMRLYRGGRPVSTASKVPPYEGGSLLIVGAYHGGWPFRGDLAELRVWDHVRSEAQIADQWRSTVPKDTPGLIAKYPA